MLLYCSWKHARVSLGPILYQTESSWANKVSFSSFPLFQDCVTIPSPLMVLLFQGHVYTTLHSHDIWIGKKIK